MEKLNAYMSYMIIYDMFFEELFTFKNFFYSKIVKRSFLDIAFSHSTQEIYIWFPLCHL